MTCQVIIGWCCSSRKRWLAASALAACVSWSVLVPVAPGAARLPTLLADGPRGRAYTWQVRPAQITYTGDGSGILGGSGGTSAAHPGRLKWTGWTRTGATGSGTVWIDDCKPDCADGTFNGHRVKVNAFRPVKGHFTRLTLRYTYRGKRSIDRRGIWQTGGYGATTSSAGSSSASARD